jgi:hypothetical protein
LSQLIHIFNRDQLGCYILGLKCEGFSPPSLLQLQISF